MVNPLSWAKNTLIFTIVQWRQSSNLLLIQFISRNSKLLPFEPLNHCKIAVYVPWWYRCTTGLISARYVLRASATFWGTRRMFWLRNHCRRPRLWFSRSRSHYSFRRRLGMVCLVLLLLILAVMGSKIDAFFNSHSLSLQCFSPTHHKHKITPSQTYKMNINNPTNWLTQIQHKITSFPRPDTSPAVNSPRDCSWPHQCWPPAPPWSPAPLSSVSSPSHTAPTPSTYHQASAE